MKILVQTGLYGSGLLKITSPELINRYNDALEAMGLIKTSLTSFSIDMIGWSPEISEEMEDIFYLTHSLANPMAIILTIDQKKCPIYFPYHSFDRSMFEYLFEHFTMQIMDITTDEAIWIDIDNGTSHYKHPKDLLLVDSFDLLLETKNKLIQGASKQKELVKQLLSSDNLWECSESRNKIIESGKHVGNLQKRKFTISDISYSDIRMFFTEALGGVYILRSIDASSGDDLIITEDKKWSKNSKHIYHIHDKNMFSVLLNAGYFDINTDYLSENPDILQRKKDIILSNLLLNKSIDLDYFNLTGAQLKSYVNEYKEDLPEIFFEIERLEKKLCKGVQIDVNDISLELQYMIAIPNEAIPQRFHGVLLRIISHIDTTGIINFYRYNKSKFYDEFTDYNEQKKQFVTDFIIKYYLSYK
jgi:hypothetical protein